MEVCLNISSTYFFVWGFGASTSLDLDTFLTDQSVFSITNLFLSDFVILYRPSANGASVYMWSLGFCRTTRRYTYILVDGLRLTPETFITVVRIPGFLFVEPFILLLHGILKPMLTFTVELSLTLFTWGDIFKCYMYWWPIEHELKRCHIFCFVSFKILPVR